MSLLPRANTCELLASGHGSAFWLGAYYADRNHWLTRAREAGISKELRQLRVQFARNSHRTYLRFRRSLKVPA